MATINENVLARSMKTGKSMTVAVIISELSNMFSMRAIDFIEKVITIPKKAREILKEIG